MSLETVALATVAVDIIKGALRAAREMKGEHERQHRDEDLDVRAAEVADALERPRPNVLELSREAIEERAAKPSAEEMDRRAKVGSLALAISPEQLFRDARRRIELVFRLNFGVALALAVILLAGIVGAIVSAVFLRQNIWVLAFGGITVADLIGVYAFKPLKAINGSLVATQRLDGIHLRLHKQLPECDQLETPAERIKCQTEVWKSIEAEFATLA